MTRRARSPDRRRIRRRWPPSARSSGWISRCRCSTRAYLARIAHGDFGRSYLTRQSVLHAILERLPATAYLALTSLLVAALAGIALGCLSALLQGSVVDLTC